MALLLNTDIEDIVNKRINGKVARVGGTVGQLLSYKNCEVEEINVDDGGFGAIRNFNRCSGLKYNLKVVKHYVKQEKDFLKNGASVIRDRKSIITDAHDLIKKTNLKERYNAVISSNMIEHSPNPIFLLLNFHFILKQDGYQYHAIPHYKYTYDCYRKPTSVEHLLKDFINMTPFDDETHNQDYIDSAIVKHGWQKEFHKKYPVAYPYMHFHVFDEYNTFELFNLIFEDVVNDIIKTDEFSDNIVIFKNKLKKSFAEQYDDVIKKYSNNISCK